MAMFAIGPRTAHLLIVPVPKVPEGWYHSRLQAVGRAQARYLLLILIIAAYTIGLHFSEGDTARVAVLGLDVPKQLVNAFGVLVMAVLMVALFGTFEAVRSSMINLRARLGNDANGLSVYMIDEHPSVADFLSYATRRHGRSSRITDVTGLFLYQLPILAVLAWTAELWLRGVRARPYDPSWIISIYLASAPLIVFAAVRWCLFMYDRWVKFQRAEVRLAQRDDGRSGA